MIHTREKNKVKMGRECVPYYWKNKVKKNIKDTSKLQYNEEKVYREYMCYNFLDLLEMCCMWDWFHMLKCEYSLNLCKENIQNKKYNLK